MTMISLMHFQVKFALPFATLTLVTLTCPPFYYTGVREYCHLTSKILYTGGYSRTTNVFEMKMILQVCVLPIPS